MAQASALQPPTNVQLTQAIEIVSGASEAGAVAYTGQTLFGAVMDPLTYNVINVTIAPSGRTTTVDVAPTTGQFALRLFPEDMGADEVVVTLVGASTSNPAVASEPVSYTYTPAVATDGVTQALSRLTFGATEELYTRVRAMGYEAFVNEQLNPDGISNAAFDSMRFERLLRRENNGDGVVRRFTLMNDMAHSGFSERQLQDVYGQFWANHFHATIKNSEVHVQLYDDREFFRENAFGSFEDMLLYSARSPLMSQFLDNDESRVGRLNENYGREIMELHTVGVNAGYGDQDVIEVSRIFTGWNYVQTNPGVDAAREYDFQFRSDRHDTGDKFIPFLNVTINGRSGDAGVQEGEELIAILADHPSTRNFVCGKIVQKFVADEPPQNFVDICTQAWVDTDGDMGEVLRAIITAPEFINDPALQRSKGRTPYEYAVNLMRAMDMSPDTGSFDGLQNFFRRFRDGVIDAGFDPYEFLVPTGLEEVGSAWINSASLIGQYRELTDIVERPGEYDLDLGTKTAQAGLLTAEEVAAYLLTLATADRFTLEEYESLVSVLKGPDGIFDPTGNETSAFNRAAGLLIALPSVQLQ